MNQLPSPQRQRWPRDLWNELHCAVGDGSTQRALALLITSGLIDTDRGGHDSSHVRRIVRMLLNKGANLAIGDATNLFCCTIPRKEDLAVTELLMKAGAVVEAADSQGYTPLSSGCRQRSLQGDERADRGRSEPQQAYVPWNDTA